MGRWLTAGAAAGAALALVAGCGSGSRDGATVRPSQPGGPASSGPPAPDPTAADTRTVCVAINQAVAQGATAFGADLGTMVGHLAGGNRAGADAAKRSAMSELGALSGRVRTIAAPALDPALRAAGVSTADNLDHTAADPDLLTAVKTADDLNLVLNRITSTAYPLAAVCVQDPADP
ncbi:hypothetical protein GCM10023322_27760 [Rugosimonospora acidiphila]|uniref:Lipoprotein n=1 Tax=Rugosimonospora acidiphila TaxID=556531 RepID=A0ABP9RSY1_9ACTN